MLDRVGVVLAGGRSTRFGSDKFFHVVDGTEMGLRAIRCLQPIVDQVVVVGRTELPDSWGAQTLFGPREGSGPLGAILDCSEVISSHHLLVVPCDMPYLTSVSVSKLLDAMNTPEIDAVFAHSTTLDEPQWLAASWRSDCVRNRILPLYQDGVRSIRDVARRVRHLLVDLPLEQLSNLNESVSS